MKEMKCKCVIGKNKDNRINAIIRCDKIKVEDFSESRCEYTVYIYKAYMHDGILCYDLTGTLFCNKYEIEE